MENMLIISEKIKQAIKDNQPVVALESTIIAHGMPYPENMETALAVEQIVKQHGAIPATIAIIGGKIKVGLSKEEIEYLGKQGGKILKTAKRDIPYIVSQGLDGATTVSATAYIASLAKIKIFATGGIGGVHRGASETFDISSDLESLATTNVAVVCAGAKSILDLGLTLEYLETKSVEVIGYQTDFLPAFYTAKSEFMVNHRLNSPEEIAKLIQAKWALRMKGGILITNPIPEIYSMDSKIINQTIDEAIIEMKKLKITGNKTTPYLLAKIKEITSGNSLAANIQLVYNNAALAAEIAKLI